MLQLLALLLSVAIEAPIVAALVNRVADVGESVTRRLMIAAAATFLTHPFAWWASFELATLVGDVPRLIIIETAVVAAETLFFAKVARWSWRLSFVCALVANIASFGIGLIIWPWLT